MPVPTTNLVLDVRAGVGETLSGSEITTWADQSGNGNDLTGQTGNSSRPISSTDAEGNPVVKFLWGFGSAHPKGYFDIPATLSGIATRATTIYIVGKQNTGVEGQCLVSFDGYAIAYAWINVPSSAPPFMSIATRNSSQRVPINKCVLAWGGRASESVTQFNKTRVTGISAVGSSTGLSGGDIGRYGTGANQYFSGEIYRILIYSAEHSNSEMDTIINILIQENSIVTDYFKLLVFEGDSLTAGVGSTELKNFPNQLVTPNFDWLTFNLGKGSAKIGLLATASTIANEASAHIDPLYSEFPYSRRVLISFAGTNDIGGDAQTGAQTFTRLTTWLATEQAVGWEVGVMTIPDRDSSFDVPVADYNNLIRADKTTIDFVIDVGKGSPIEPRLSNGSDTTYYDPDGLHLNNTGNYVISEALKNRLSCNSLLHGSNFFG